MKKNFDFVIILAICVLLCGVLYLLYDHTDDNSSANAGGIVALRGVSVRAPRSSFDMGVESVSSSRFARASVPTYSRPRPQLQGSTMYQPISSSLTPQSANSVSYGTLNGGGRSSSVSGVSIMGGASQTLASGTSVVRPNVSSSSSNRSLLGVSSSSSYVDANIVRQSAPRLSSQSFGASSLNVSSSVALQSNSRGLSVYGGDMSVASYSDPMSVSSRANSPHRAPSGVNNSWLNWLDQHFQGEGADLNMTGARAAYDAMMEDWNDGMGNPPTYEEWLEWLQSGDHTINGNTYRFPIGNTLPLVLMALSYMVMIYVRRKK